MTENFEGENFRGCSASLVPRLQAMESWVGLGNDASVLQPRDFWRHQNFCLWIMQILVSRLSCMRLHTRGQDIRSFIAIATLILGANRSLLNKQPGSMNSG